MGVEILHPRSVHIGILMSAHLWFSGWLGRCSESSYPHKFTNYSIKLQTRILRATIKWMEILEVWWVINISWHPPAWSPWKTLGSILYTVLPFFSSVLPHQCLYMWWVFICKCFLVLHFNCMVMTCACWMYFHWVWTMLPPEGRNETCLSCCIVLWDQLHPD